MKKGMNIRKCVMAAAAVAMITILAGCGPDEHEKAKALVDEGYAKIEMGQLNTAKILADSVHKTYPKCVAERRLAKALEDTVVYIESQRTLAYSDSLLVTLLPQIDPLLKKFRYEKNDQYEDHGKYVHRLLNTGSNTSRCYIQAYVYDHRVTEVKSYYFGQNTLNQTAIEASVSEEVFRHDGTSHGFDADGYHSILSFDGDKALEFLNFISSHQGDRIRINLLGTNRKNAETNYVYYLNDQEKIALQETYLLGILMNDIKQLEDAIRIASARIEKYAQQSIK